MRRVPSRSRFTHLCNVTARRSGHASTFGAAVAIIIAWLVTGPIFHYSDTWQLAINTGTTIVTFLMVFLIQNTQNRDAAAVQVKLDELLRVTEGAHTALLDLEQLEEEELGKIYENYAKLAQRARDQLRRGKPDTGTPDVTEP